MYAAAPLQQGEQDAGDRVGRDREHREEQEVLQPEHREHGAIDQGRERAPVLVVRSHEVFDGIRAEVTPQQERPVVAEEPQVAGLREQEG
ncbi:hypothetical protein [Nocardioides sp. B-3]|uniref:hypothetical protein n=1 Tax=Nocardioides sp. B-3 TaxID=2895565 RepID=UPI00215313AD|nr:hypothetical protein [Nocardioides sp. B-3]UUZ60472.1 hypothetical protein LP418_06205 [Nocardioides sp. B-3]